MNDRTVTVKLRADVAGYIAGMSSAKRQTATFATDIEKRINRGTRSVNTLSTGFLAAGAAAGVGVGKAVSSFAQFDKAMSSVEAATHETEANMRRLRAAAIQAGADTKYSATEAADGIEQLAKAGVSTDSILRGGLRGALDLAAAGNLDVGEAAETAATAMTQFKLSGDKIPHLADLLAAGAGKAQGEVHDLALAMKQGGLVASQFDLSVEETVGTLSAFASAGLVGSDAGTSFKQMLLQLANPSAKSAKLMDRLGLSAYDAQGNFVGIAKFAGQLHDKLQDLTPAQRNAALATIFGSDAIRAANVLYKQGEKGIAAWIRRVNEQGYATDTAARKMNNLSGDIEKLTGELETAFIGAGSGGNSFLRGLTQDAEGLVHQFNELSPEAQRTAFQVTAVSAAALLALGGIGKLVVGANEARVALLGLGLTASRARTAMLGLGKAGLIAAAAWATYELAAWVGEATVADVRARDLQRSLKSLASTGQLGNAGLRLLSSDMDLFNSRAKTTNDALARLTDTAKLTNNTWVNTFAGAWVIQKIIAMSKLEKQTKQLDTALAGMAEGGDLNAAQDAFDQISKKLREAGWSTERINQAFPQFTAAAAQATAAAKTNAEAHKVVDAAMRGEKVSADQLRNAMKLLSNNALGVEQANLQFRDSLASVRKSLQDNGKSLSENNAKGRANRAALANAAAAALAYADSVKQSTNSSEKANVALARSRERLVRVATQYLGSREAAEKYVTEVLGIPATKQTKLQVKKDEAERNLRKLRAQLDDPGLTKERRAKINADIQAAINKLNRVQAELAAIRDRNVYVNVITRQRNAGGHPHTTTFYPRAGGGPIEGPGGPTADKAGLFALSDGEFVFRTMAVRSLEGAYGSGVMAYMNRHGRFPGLAGGGPVAVQGMASGGQVVTLPYLQSQVPKKISPLADNDYVKALAKQTAAAKKLKAAEEKLYRLRHAKKRNERQIYLQEKRVTAARKALTAATNNLKKQTQALADARKEAVQYGQQIASQLTSTAGIVGAGSAAGILNRLQKAGAQVGELNKLIGKLRKAGLSQSLLDQIIQADPAAGLATAKQILAGGAGIVASLNKAQAALEKQAYAIGAAAAYDVYGVKKKAGGGLVRGPGGPRDDKAGLYALSDHEYVMTAEATRRIGVRNLDRWNYGHANAGYSMSRYARTPYMTSRPIDGRTVNVTNNVYQNREAPAVVAQKVSRETVWALRR